MVAHACYVSIWRVEAGELLGFETSPGYIVYLDQPKPHCETLFQKKKKSSGRMWHRPVIPAPWESKVEEPKAQPSRAS